jgi:O-antigen/teichoic acid export membrane protein
MDSNVKSAGIAAEALSPGQGVVPPTGFPGSTFRARARSLVSSALVRRLASDAFWSLLGSVLGRLLALLAAIVVARRLGAAAFGEFNLVQTTTGMLMAFGGFGLNTTATKYLAGHYRGDPEAAGRVVALSGLLAALVGGGTGLLLASSAGWVAGSVLGAPQLATALRVGSLLLLLGPVNGTQLGVLMGLQRFRTIGVVTTLTSALSIPLLVGGAVLGGTLGCVVGLVASAAANNVVYAVAVHRATRACGVRPVYRQALREWRIVLSYSVPTTLGNLLLAPATWAASAVVANQPHGVRELGLFAAANQWRNAIVLVATSVGAVLFPLFAHLHDSGRARSFARAFWVSVVLTAAASFVAAGALAACSPWVMRVYGAEFREAVEVMVLLVAAGALAAPLAIVGHAIAGAGRMWLSFALNAGWATVLVGTTYLLRARGAYGLSIAYTAAYAVHLGAALACARGVLRGAHPPDVATVALEG